MARREQQHRSPDPQVHSRRQVPAADRPQRLERRFEQPDPARPPGAHGDRRRERRAVRRRRLRQPASDRFRREDRGLQAALGRLRQPAERRQAARVRSGQAVAAAVRQPGALREALARRAGLCLRPRQRSDPGVRKERQLREGVPGRAGDTPERLGVGPRVLRGRDGALHLRRRRREQPDPHARPADRRDADALWPRGQGWPASSSGCTTWRSIRGAICTPPRSAPAAGRRNSSAWNDR